MLKINSTRLPKVLRALKCIGDLSEVKPIVVKGSDVPAVLKDEPGVYVAFSEKQEFLYCGSTNRFGVRSRGHLSKNGRWKAREWGYLAMFPCRGDIEGERLRFNEAVAQGILGKGAQQRRCSRY